MQRAEHSRKFARVVLEICCEQAFLSCTLYIYIEYSVPMAALLAREALEMIDVILGSHHHLKRRNHLGTRRAVACNAEQPETSACAAVHVVHQYIRCSIVD